VDRQLQSLRIGAIVLSPPVGLGSLSGYSDLIYRLICRELGAPYCATEMMLDRQLLLAGRLRRRLIQTHPDDHPVAGQIIGNEPEIMARAAGELVASGFDVVDVNFACPARPVLARRRGGYLLKDPDRAIRILRAVAAAAACVTLKLRIGFEGSDRRDFWAIAEAAWDAGVAALCVHGRTVRQGYRGPADWSFIAEVKRRFPDRTVIASGDATDPAAAMAMLRQTSADGVLFARAALGNPWIFRQFREHLAGKSVRAPSVREQRRLLERHFAGVVDLYGPERGLKFMARFGIKYARMHPCPSRARAAFVGVRTEQGFRAVLENLYRDDYDERSDRDGDRTEREGSGR
jgi:nifR3 family TIM-barrel protein